MTIQQLFQTFGSRLNSTTSPSFLLSSQDCLWYFDHGTVEIFSVDRDSNGETGRRFHLCTMSPDSLLFPIQSSKHEKADFGCLAVLQQGTTLYSLPRATLLTAFENKTLLQDGIRLTEKWIEYVSQGCVKNNVTRCSHFLTQGEDVDLKAGDRFTSGHNIAWVSFLKGRGSFLDLSQIDVAAPYFPLITNTWLSADLDSRISCVNTTHVFSNQDLLINALEQFHRVILHCTFLERAGTLELETEKLYRKKKQDHLFMKQSLDDFVSVMDPNQLNIHEENPDDLLFSACLHIGKAQNIQFTPPAVLTDQMDKLTEICKISRVRKRMIRFRKGWEHQENGPILAFLTKEQRPVALLPEKPSGYTLFDPLSKTTSKVTEEICENISEDGVCFYRPFSEDALRVFKILKFSVHGSNKDLGIIITMSILSALLGLIPPLVSAQIFDTVIPGAERTMLFQYGIALFAAAIGTAAFQLTRSFAMLRAETRMDSSLQFAVMDRLLSLAPTFFRQFTVGDLASRVNAITAIRQHLTGVGLSSMLTGFFSFFYLIVLFYYSFKLAFVAILTTIPPFLVTVGSGYFDIKYGRKLLNIKGRVSGIVLQFLTGLQKLRVAGAEHRAFGVWAHQFSHEKQVAYRVGMVSNVFTTFHCVYPILAIGTIYFTASFYLKESLSTGSFIAFVTAYGSFMAAILGLGSSLVTAIRVIPLYERAHPILACKPEIKHNHVHPGILDGNIEVSNITFTYDKNSPNVLQDFSLTISPGEFIAIVGPSGSGKSTLLRLLLGFEKPDRGVIFYSNQNLQNIDVQAVRQQIGTVLQGGRVIAGDIFVNIVGSSELTIEQAWEAARQAGFEQDIRNMPMGMHTFVAEGGTNLSGGQRQRLLIARSFAMKPQIMFFDEATSALDNTTQEIVSSSMSKMHITRLVIAHRLSTIKKADKIYVINNGRVEQKGSYDELINQKGLFANLAKRQLV